MGTSKKILSLLIIGGMYFFTACSDQKEELTAQENQYIHVGENWQALSGMESSEGQEIKVFSKSQKYKIGEEMHFEITSKTDGLLYVVYTSDKDTSLLLYPNKMSSSNKIKAGQTFMLPPKESEWKIQAAEPAGKSLLTFFIFPNEAMALQKLKNYTSMPVATKQLVLVEEPERYTVDSVVVETVK